MEKLGLVFKFIRMNFLLVIKEFKFIIDELCSGYYKIHTYQELNFVLVITEFKFVKDSFSSSNYRREVML